MSLLEKSPPYDSEAEKAVIASMIMDQEAIDKIASQILPGLFYASVHRTIVEHILQLYHKGIPVDVVTLHSTLSQDQNLKDISFEYLMELIDFIPTAANVEYYFNIVVDKARLRKLIQICHDTLADVYQMKEDVATIVDQAELKVFQLSQDRIRSDFVHVQPVLKESLNTIAALYQKKTNITGVSSGFFELDKLTSGFQNSDLVIIAARPSMGKTALCLNIAEHIGLREGKLVAFFSLEMAKEQLVQRLISAHSRIDSQKIRTGQVSKMDFPKITQTVSELMKSKIFIDDTPASTPLEIRAKARRLLAKEEIDILMVDYLQLIQSSSARRGDNRQNEIAEISRALKTLARELRKPVVAISQLSRSVEIRTGDHRPKLSDLRDSGAIEQDADLVIFIYRDEYYNPEDIESQGKAELIIAKQRNGPTGSVDVAFNHAIARFDNLRKYM